MLEVDHLMLDKALSMMDLYIQYTVFRMYGQT